jgi:hypothetical protein
MGDDDETGKMAELRQAAAVLCAMPIWELRHEALSRRRQFLRMMDPRPRPNGEHRKRIQPKDVVKDERVQSLLTLWLDGSLTFVDSTPSGRLVP